ncbi:dienelactone hydrolase family-domain-containing protein [Ilyonectria robusta]|uniref:dienelactone hydrolase family-domain-containing protein n=1 Tax=Ilyonectria robusta TaxID=1079257 RepID=UPI001E8DA7EB|nr:dienelactone hydrolase family-domain-containing protein [Ilyonectria robusta]KAH8684926.1 dienelactone hydrolase family-domain-containing protein [Ilyonectria robusta]
MLSLHCLVAICGFASAAHISESNLGDIIQHVGEPVGSEQVHDGVTMYISPTPQANNPKMGVLYLTDAFGLPLLQNKLLADSFARAGFTTIMPDIFRGDPAPHDIYFDADEFLAKHTTNVTDPVIETTIRYMRDTLCFDRIAVTGYCFGGRYAFRFLQEGRGADIGFAAHPSFLQDSEVLAISGPASIAAAEIDTLFEPARRFEVESMLNQTAHPYQVAIYSGTFHGFGTRANISIPEQKFGKEEAFFQAVRWFKAW